MYSGLVQLQITVTALAILALVSSAFHEVDNT